MKFLIPFFCILLISCSSNADVEEDYSQALKMFSSQQFERAESSCNELLKVNKNHFPTLLLKAKILFYTGRKNDSIKLLKKINRKFPLYVDGKIFLIKALIETDCLEEAEWQLNEFLINNPGDYRTYELFSKLAKKNKNLDLRFSFQKKAEQCLEGSVSVFLELAAIYKAFGLNDISSNYLLKSQLLTQDMKLKKMLDEINIMKEEKE